MKREELLNSVIEMNKGILKKFGFKTINFHNVVEAHKASDLFGWERHHNFGSLEFTVTEEQVKLLKEKKIGFWVEKG